VDRPDYGTWIRPKRIAVFWILALTFAGMSLLGFANPLLALLGRFCLPFIFIALVISFEKASASSLPFADGSFTNVVSCLTFHEVRDVEDKLESFREALRVLAPGGSFAVFDLFDDRQYFPERDQLLAELARRGAEDLAYIPIRDLMPLPFPLNGPKSLGHGALVTGRRAPILPERRATGV
jgi:SAM-dependent methyltransferase